MTCPDIRAKPFVSYSANFEDVILHRLFGGQAEGFFVDVGAAHPVDENDTFTLYGQGWRGINVEPNPKFFAALEAERPEDRNLCLALSNSIGEQVWHEVVGTGLSTLSTELAQQHAQHGHEVVAKTVKISTLAEILSQQGERPKFRLLKVDVEGHEEQVLLGNDWRRFRPDIVLLEATLPESRERRIDNCRALLEAEGYVFRYFDGLNDFFTEKSFDPGTAFDAPPNIFDNLVPQALNVARRDARVAEDYAKSLEEGLQEARRYAGSLEEHLAIARNGLERVRQLAEQQGKAAEREAECQAHLATEVSRAERLERAIADERAQAERRAEELEAERGRVRQFEAKLSAQLDVMADLKTERESLYRLVLGSIRAGRISTENVLEFSGVHLQRTSSQRIDVVSEAKLTGVESQASDDLTSTSALSLVAAQAATTEMKLRQMRHERDDAFHQLKRYREAVVQLRAENLQLTRLFDASLMRVPLADEQHAAIIQNRAAFMATMATTMEAELAAKTQELAALSHELQAAKARAMSMEQLNFAIVSSRSWKIAGPYRVIGRRLKRLFRRP